MFIAVSTYRHQARKKALNVVIVLVGNAYVLVVIVLVVLVVIVQVGNAYKLQISTVHTCHM